MKILLILFTSLRLYAAEEAGVREFKTAINQFAGTLYKGLAGIYDGDYLFSPLGAEVALAFLESGARGATAVELRNISHIPDDKTKVESALKSLLGPKGTDFHTVNKMYIQRNYSIRDEFRTSASSVYGAEVEHVDFTQKLDTLDVMNSWVEKQTNYRIRNLIYAHFIEEDTKLVFVNTFRFKANWSVPFPLVNTKQEDFYRTPTKVVRLDTLHLFEKDFKYSENLELRAEFLELPMGDELSMVIVLPKDRDGLKSLEQRIDQVFHLGHPMVSTNLNVALPKFRIKTLVDIKRMMQNLGVDSPFNEHSADFKGITDDSLGLIINEIVQNAFIDVSEGGVQAAVGTSVVIDTPIDFRRTASSRDFKADHPFLFYIKLKDLIILAGRVTYPED